MIIDPRFNGPPGSANGGYSAGLFADALAAAGSPVAGGPAISGTVEVTLRQPPPLSAPLTLTDGEVRSPEGALIAEVRPVAAVEAIVPAVDWATATAASASYPGFLDHPFPSCYVCGPEHAEGLRIFPGRLPDGRTAAPFTAPARVDRRTVWAALDCPGGWSVLAPGRPYLLGRIAATVHQLPAPGDECVVMGATIDSTGRKAQVHSTLYGPTGAVLGQARATWIALPPNR